MKTKFLQTAVTVYLGAALLMFLTACNGGSSDPLKNYDIKGGPVTDAPSEKQTELKPDLFTVEINGITDGTGDSFIEGINSQIQIKVTPKSLQIKSYTLNLIEFEHNTSPTIEGTSTPGLFTLNWMPPIGIIDPGGSHRTLKAKLLIVVTEAADQRLLGTAGKPVSLQLYVSKNSVQPKITNFTSLEKGVNEGTKVPFIIDVNDPASIAGGYPPKIVTDPYIHSNTEAFTADGSNMVQRDETRSSYFENLGGGKWRFYYVINAERFVDNRDRKGNVDPNASSVEVCFFLNVKNVNGSSDPKNPRVCFSGRYAAQAPAVNWEAQNSSEIKSGVESNLKFSIQSANGLGKVEIKDQAKLLAGLSGTKSLKCEVVSAQNPDQNCILTWTPTCSRTNSNKKLSIKVENKISNKVKSTLFEKDLVVLAYEELCPVKKPVAKSTQATKGAAR